MTALWKNINEKSYFKMISTIYNLEYHLIVSELSIIETVSPQQKKTKLHFITSTAVSIEIY